MKLNKILLSIVIPTLNNEKDIRKFLKSLNRQNFPKNKLEIILSDGGSKDKTISIAKQFGAKVVKNPFVFADPGVNVGIKKARGELIMVLACDNIYEDKNSISKITAAFQDKKIYAAFPTHYSSKKDSLFTKYINTFTDPFNHFVYGHAANGRTFKKIYKTLESNDTYDVYDYTSNPDRPMIALAQGFTVRKDFSRSKESAYDDTLPIIELINKRHSIAFVHSVKLYHHTIRNLRHFMKKQTWATVNALQKKNYGISQRMNKLSKAQQFRAKIWPLYALSFIVPCAVASYEVIHDREPMWIFHPILCMISAISSMIAIVLYLKDKNYEFER